MLPINVSFFVTNVVPLTHHTSTHLYTRTRIHPRINKKFTANSFARFTSHPMEPLSPTIDGRRSFDRLYTFLPPPPSTPPVRAIQLAIKCIVVSFGVARETPIYLLPLGSLLRSFEHFRQVEFRAAFMGFFRNFNDVQLREFVRFPISPVNICRISCESLANYHLLPRQSSPTIFFFLNVNVRNAVEERKYIFRRNCNALLKSLKALASNSRQSEVSFQLSIFLIPVPIVLRDTKRVVDRKEGVL